MLDLRPLLDLVARKNTASEWKTAFREQVKPLISPLFEEIEAKVRPELGTPSRSGGPTTENPQYVHALVFPQRFGRWPASPSLQVVVAPHWREEPELKRSVVWVLRWGSFQPVQDAVVREWVEMKLKPLGFPLLVYGLESFRSRSEVAVLAGHQSFDAPAGSTAELASRIAGDLGTVVQRIRADEERYRELFLQLQLLALAKKPLTKANEHRQGLDVARRALKDRTGGSGDLDMASLETAVQAVAKLPYLEPAELTRELEHAARETAGSSADAWTVMPSVVSTFHYLTGDSKVLPWNGRLGGLYQKLGLLPAGSGTGPSSPASLKVLREAYTELEQGLREATKAWEGFGPEDLTIDLLLALAPQVSRTSRRDQTAIHAPEQEAAEEDGADEGVAQLVEESSLLTQLDRAGLILAEMERSTVLRLLASLKVKPFAILTGVSGTGKTLIARALAQYLVGLQPIDFDARDVDRYAFVTVRPDWTDSRKLFGYFNPSTGLFHAHPVLRILLAAYGASRAIEGVERRYVLILDEMNLAKVEYYFADVLSLMESPGELTSLHQEARCVALSGSAAAARGVTHCPKGEDREACRRCVFGPLRLGQEVARTASLDDAADFVPPSLAFPRNNLVVIGTVNVDETTSTFSPKVLDRAFVAEFLDAELTLFLQRLLEQDRFGPLVQALGKNPAVENVRLGCDFLEVLYRHLRPVVLHFGYRVVSEMMGFLLQRCLDTGGTVTLEDLDYLICSKVLPKIRGRDEQIGPVLLNLLRFCHADWESNEDWAAQVAEARRLEDIDSYWRFRMAAGKIFSLIQRGRESGFVAYF